MTRSNNQNEAKELSERPKEAYVVFVSMCLLDKDFFVVPLLMRMMFRPLWGRTDAFTTLEDRNIG